MILDLENDAIVAAEKLVPLIPHLSTETLVDLVGVGNQPCVRSIASANGLPSSVCASLAETADQDILVRLLKNNNAKILDFSFLRILERFGENLSILLALENRNDLPSNVWWGLLRARVKLIYLIMSPVDKQIEFIPTDEAIVALLWASPLVVRASYLTALYDYEALTPSLIIHSLNCGAFDVATALLAKTSKIDVELITKIFTDENRGKILELANQIKIPEIILDDFMDAVEEMIQFNNKPLSLAA